MKPTGSIWNNPRYRAIAVQTVVMILFLLACWVLVSNTATNLQNSGIASGFDFLNRPAGFDILQHLIPYDEQSSYGRAFLVALLNTLLVSLIGVTLATVLGFVIGIARLSHNFLVSRLALCYIEIIRNIPLLLQLFFWYFAVLRTLPHPRASLSLGEHVFLNIRGLYSPKPVFLDGSGWFMAAAGLGLAVWAALAVAGRRRKMQTGRDFPAHACGLAVTTVLAGAAWLLLDRPVALEVPVLSGFNFAGGMVLIPELVALLMALTIYTAAFIAEIVRAGILAVSHGQSEAAMSLGLTRWQTLKFVVIPQAMRVIVPPLTSQYLNLTKNSSLAAAIAYPDLVLVFAGTVLLQTGQAVEVIALTMGVYLLISLTISLAMNLFNRRIALTER